MPRELILESYGVRVRVVDAADAGICSSLADVLPPGSERGQPAAVEICYVLRRSRPGGTEPGAYTVLRDGEARFHAPAPEAAVQWLCGEIDSAIALNSRAGLFVHAGVVGWRGRAIVVPGRSMTGKSTLVAELVRRGATYYSDEFAVLDDEGRVHPYARTPMLRDARSGGARRAGPPALRSVERVPLPVSLIVSTPFQADASWCPKVVTGARAVLPIIDNTLLARVEAARTLRLSARMATSVVTLEGVRPGAEVAAPRILEFLDGLLDASPSASPGSAGPREPSVLERARALRATAAQEPGRIARAAFVVMGGVLEPHEHARLLEYACARRADFASSGVMAPDGTSHIDPQFRKSGTLFHAHDVVKPLESRLRRLLPHVRRELGLAWFPLGRVEVQMAVHQEGGFFGAHTDDGRQEVAGRRLTCVFYLHRAPKRFAGGELVIHDTEVRDGVPVRAGAHVAVEPADNSAVFFPSSLLHEVRPVRRETDAFEDSRFSVNVWFWVGHSPLSAPAAAAPEQSAG
jgi:predicted 2-oxoglutarate/Fe(II)-dependent dioxygenase YbiX